MFKSGELWHFELNWLLNIQVMQTLSYFRGLYVLPWYKIGLGESSKRTWNWLYQCKKFCFSQFLKYGNEITQYLALQDQCGFERIVGFNSYHFGIKSTLPPSLWLMGLSLQKWSTVAVNGNSVHVECMEVWPSYLCLHTWHGAGTQMEPRGSLLCSP